MFTVGGKNTYPAEIEGALCGHPEVLSCLVVGVPHEDLGQVPHALVQADGDLDEAGVQAFLRERLEPTRCRAQWNSSTIRCATTPARPAGRRCATRSLRGGLPGPRRDEFGHQHLRQQPDVIVAIARIAQVALCPGDVTADTDDGAAP